MATLKDVAKRAGVSTATVSYAMNKRSDKVSDEVAMQIFKAAEELGYQPNVMARALRTKKNNIIGVLAEDVTRYQVSNILQGINRVVGRNNYQVLLYDFCFYPKIVDDRGYLDYSIIEQNKDLIQEKVDFFESIGVAGCIYISMHNRDITGLIQTKLPMAYAYCYVEDEKNIVVDCDNQEISEELILRMINKGHREIGLISGPTDSMPTYRRMMGYMTALMKKNLSFDKNLVEAGNWSEESGYDACVKLLENNEDITAIYAMNDWMALGAMKALKERKIQIPEDIEIVGFDDIDICSYVEPSLTSVRLPLMEIGCEVANSLIECIQCGEVKEWKKILPCVIQERDSFSTAFNKCLINIQTRRKCL